MTPPDLDALEKLHDKLNRKLAAWEKKKLAALLQSFYEAETQIKALLVTAEGWEKTRLESLLVEVDRVMDKMVHDAELWVKGRSDVSPESPLASLAQYPIIVGGNTALAAVGVSATFNMIHLPVLSYLQDYQLGLIKRITQEVREQVKEELKRGYIMGESIPDIAKRLRNTKLGKGVWPSAQKRAEVVARTEIIRASNQGALYVYRQYDVKRVMWLAAADERTCEICGTPNGLHRKIFPIDQVPFGGPPAHPRCRCFITPHIVTTEEEGLASDILARKNAKDFREQLEKRISVPRSLGAAAKNIYVKTDISLGAKYPVTLKEGTYITGVVKIAEGNKIRSVNRLVEAYKLSNGNKTQPKDWKKMRGTGIIKVDDKEHKAEIHWYQAKGVGKVEWKVKRIIDG